MPTPTPVELVPRIGEPVREIETPAIVADLDIMEANMARYDRIAAEHDVNLRSHIKTHKIPDIAHRQVALSTGNGILCQSLGEVEVMAQNGIEDIYLSYMVVQPTKLDRLLWLSEKLPAFATTVDCRGNVDPLQAAAAERGVTVDVVLELDIGMGRVGATLDEIAEFGEYVAKQDNLNVTGLMCFEGHVKKGLETRDELEAACLEAMDEVADGVERLEEAGIPIDDVKVGSTGTSRFSAKHDIVTEINPGMYAFNDANVMALPIGVGSEDCALRILTSVISTPAPDRVIVDGGSKTISMDTSTAPAAVGRDDLEYTNYSEEHGWIDAEPGHGLSVGDRLTFIAPHVCTTINQHDTLIGVRDGVVEEVWSVQARGKVR